MRTSTAPAIVLRWSSSFSRSPKTALLSCGFHKAIPSSPYLFSAIRPSCSSIGALLLPRSLPPNDALIRLVNNAAAAQPPSRALLLVPSPPRRLSTPFGSKKGGGGGGVRDRIRETTPAANVAICCVMKQLDGTVNRQTLNISKPELVDKLGIPFRDVRLVDPDFKDHNPVVLVSKGAVLLRLGYVSAIIKHNSIWLFRPEDSFVSLVIKSLWKCLDRKRRPQDDSVTTKGLANSPTEGLTEGGPQEDHRNRAATIAASGGAGVSSPGGGVSSYKQQDRLNGEEQTEGVEKDAAESITGRVVGQQQQQAAGVWPVKWAAGSHDKWPFEFQCIESCMQVALDGFENSLDKMAGRVDDHVLTDTFGVGASSAVPRLIPAEFLTGLMRVKNDLQALEVLLTALRSAVVKVLKDDEDMAAMYLTHIKQVGGRDKKNHSEVEIIFETYLQHLEELFSELVTQKQRIQHHEELTRLHLDIHRNEIMQINVRIALFTLTCSLAAVLTGLFGMNLKNHCEDYDYAFLIGVCIILPLSSVGLFSYNTMARIIGKQMTIRPFNVSSSSSRLPSSSSSSYRRPPFMQ
eukprot:GHVS01055779.1.p1 GENE.GHVS01055779.1~~GHVS01055779.1.p1  ORF type:complete len:576 (-),score=118.79 GHVS01055779.1:434-2161(-)